MLESYGSEPEYMGETDLTLFGLPVMTDPALKNDECYMVHPDVIDALLQGYRCIRDMPDHIAEIENLYKPRLHRSWIVRLIFGRY